MPPKSAQDGATPRVTPLPLPPGCGPDRLRSFAPSVGELLEVDVRREPRSQHWHAAAERVDCGKLAMVECLDWARDRATARGRSRRLSPSVKPGLDEKGSRVTLRYGKRRLTRIVSSGAELVSLVRELEAQGEAVVIEKESRAFAYDMTRVDVDYYLRSPTPRHVWSAEVRLRVPAGQRAAWESLRTLHSDLERAGLELTSASSKRALDQLLDRLLPAAKPRPDGWAGFLTAVALAQRVPPRAPPDSGEPLLLALTLNCKQPAPLP